MKVRTLIHQLLKMNLDATVKLNMHDGYEVLYVTAREGDKDTVWLEGEDDLDLGAELEAEFEYASQNDVDELDFYRELYQRGITPEMIDNYFGSESGEHVRKFYEEHGMTNLPASERKYTQSTNITYAELDGENGMVTQFDTWDEVELALLWWDFCAENGIIQAENVIADYNTGQTVWSKD